MKNMTLGGVATFKVRLRVPQVVTLPSPGSGRDREADRDQFYEWIWSRFASCGLLGVHEGTLLSEEAADRGLETDSWTVDSAEAPRERDWVGSQDEMEAELFFSGSCEAIEAAEVLKQIPEIRVGSVEKQEAEDWDAEWKASFLNSGAGVLIPPFWRVVPPWYEPGPEGPGVGRSGAGQEILLKINPGAGFGTGTHETTQLCLELIGEYSRNVPLSGKKVLDFGSGSGILSIGLALLGGEVDAIEIDPLAVDNSMENAALNGVQEQIKFHPSLTGGTHAYSLVVANILRPVLIDFADKIAGSLESISSGLILSGLIEKDVAPVLECYRQVLGKKELCVKELGEWRAIRF